jgi:hypothetical protein
MRKEATTRWLSCSGDGTVVEPSLPRFIADDSTVVNHAYTNVSVEDAAILVVATGVLLLG